MKISNLIQDGGFESSNLESWPGKNACIIEFPNVSGGFAALLLPSKLASSFISQIVNVVPSESYKVSISLAKDGTGSSEPVQIHLEYLDNELNEIEGLGIGLDITVQGNELPDGNEGTFKVIKETTELVPLDGRFARLTIERVAGSVSGIIIDQVSFLRVSEDVLATTVLNFYVANTGENTVTNYNQGIITTIDVADSPQAMLYLNVSGEDRVYVVGDERVSVIDVSTNTVITTIRILGTPREATIAYNSNIIASSDSSTLYVATTDTAVNVGIITIIDTATNRVTGSIAVSEGSISPVPLALTSPTGPNPNLLFVGVSNGSTTDGQLVIIDTTTSRVQSTVDVAPEPLSLLITPNEDVVIIGYRSSRTTYGVYDIELETVSNVNYDISGLNVRTESLGLSLLDNDVFFIGFEIDNPGAQPIPNNTYGSGIAAYDTNTFTKIADNIQFTQGLFVSSSNARQPHTFAQVLEADGTTECIYLDSIGSESSRIQQFLFNVETIPAVTNVSISNNSGFLTLTTDDRFILTSFNGTNIVDVVDVSTLETILELTVGDSPVVIVAIPSDSDKS